MAKNIAENKNKQEARRQKAAARERLTNWYMINMTWAFFAVIVLHQAVLRAYMTVFAAWLPHSLVTNIILWSIALLLAIGAVYLFSIWKKDGKTNGKLLAGSIFTGIAAIVMFLFSFAPQIGALIWGNVPGFGFGRIPNLVMLNVGILFALCGGALFFFGKKSGKTKSRFFSYALLSWLAALASFILAFHAQVRNLTLAIGIPFLSINVEERLIYGFMIGIGLWLIIAFVIYVIKVRKID